MPKIAVVTDSACDLPQTVLDQYGITLVPLVVRFGTDVYLDRQLTLDEFWQKAQSTPPQTSQPSAGMFEQVFAPLVEQGHHVICLVITGRHSGTYNSAYIAAQKFPGQVTIFDTLSLSLAQGYQAITAARAAAEGRSVEEIIALLESVRARIHLFIGLDTIEYLRRGGRADKLMPVLQRVVRVMNIKVLLKLVDGQLELLGVARSRKKSMQRIQQEVMRYAPAEMLIVAHTRRGDEVTGFARALAEQLNFPFEQVLLGEAGPILSSHAGPGVMAAAIVQRAAQRYPQ